MYSFSIQVSRQELNIERCLTSGQVFRWNREKDGAWRGVDGTNWYELRQSNDGVTVASNCPRETVENLFRLEDSSAELIRKIAAKLPMLNADEIQNFGLRPMRLHDPVEVLFSFVCSANNHISRITSMVKKLGDYGEILPGCKFCANAFPSLQRIAKINPSELRATGFGYRAENIPRIAQEVIDRGGESWLNSLKAMPYDCAVFELKSIKGIGRKLADCIALYGLDFVEAVPIDIHIWNFAIRHVFPEWTGLALSDSRYSEIGTWFREQFGKQAGWAQILIFADEQSNWRSRRTLRAPGKIIE